MAATIHRRLPALILLTALVLTVLVSRGQPASAVDPGVSHVYVAQGFDFADALVGAVLAANEGVPILTVGRSSVPADTDAELKRLAPIDRIVVLGGSAAVSDEIVTALGGYTTPKGNVERLAGTNRFGTASAISDALPNKVHDADKLDGLDSTAFRKLPRWEYVSIPGVAFVPNEPGAPYSRNTNDGYLAHTANAFVCYSADANLPHGAKVHSLTATVYDNESTNVSARLRTQLLSTASKTVPLEVFTEGQSGFIQQLTDTVEGTLTVDNSQSVYEVNACMFGTNSRLYGVTIKYQPVN